MIHLFAHVICSAECLSSFANLGQYYFGFVLETHLLFKSLS